MVTLKVVVAGGGSAPGGGDGLYFQCSPKNVSLFFVLIWFTGARNSNCFETFTQSPKIYYLNKLCLTGKLSTCVATVVQNYI